VWSWCGAPGWFLAVRLLRDSVPQHLEGEIGLLVVEVGRHRLVELLLDQRGEVVEWEADDPAAVSRAGTSTPDRSVTMQ